jgi:hypothetical protein
MQQKMSQHIDDQRVEGVAIAIGYRDSNGVSTSTMRKK